LIAQIQSALYRAREGIAILASAYEIDRAIYFLIYFTSAQFPAHVGRVDGYDGPGRVIWRGPGFFVSMVVTCLHFRSEL
jgi:hypothetical protein